jgi:hypothetical protein
MANELKYTHIFQQVSFGDFGFRILSEAETSVSGEHFCAISPLEDATIDFTSNTSGGDSSATDLELLTGMAIYGNFSDITVDSGKIIAYLR